MLYDLCKRIYLYVTQLATTSNVNPFHMSKEALLVIVAIVL